MPRPKRKSPKSENPKSVVKNYGLMWRRDSVFWGHGQREGDLKGFRSGRDIDFRKQIGVYVLYDEARRAVYVGQSGSGRDRLFARLSSHRRDRLALRWQYFSWFGLLTVNKSGKLSRWDKQAKRVYGTIGSMLNEIEGVLIAATEPPFNRQGAKFKGSHRYKQRLHADAERVELSELRDMLRRISKKIDKLRKKK